MTIHENDNNKWLVSGDLEILIIPEFIRARGVLISKNSPQVR
jgi:hypothetical protein